MIGARAISVLLLAMALGASQTAAAQAGSSVDPTAVRARGPGAFDVRDLMRRLEAASGALDDCVALARPHGPRFHFPGSLAIGLTITASGAVARVHTTTDTLGRPAVGRCIVRTFPTFQFDPPAGGAVTLTVPFRFDGPTLDVIEGGVMAPAPIGDAQIDESGITRTGPGELDAQTFFLAARTRRRAFQECYARVARASAAVGDGHILLEVTVAPSGRASGVRVIESSFSDATIGDCAARIARSFHLRHGPTGGSATFRLPIRFTLRPVPSFH